MLVFLLHSMKLLFTKPIPPNPAPSKIIPIISETLYIYLIGFQHALHQHRADHAAPAYKPNFHYMHSLNFSDTVL